MNATPTTPAPAPDEPAAVDAVGVRKVHRGEAGPLVILDGIDLVIPAGQFVAITGASGSGKTTLVNCLSGLDRLDAGTVRIDGVDLAGLGDQRRSALRARTMGFVFQSFNLLPVLTAEQNVALPLRLAGLSTREARGRARAELDRVGLADRATHLPSRLSGGEQQRVAVARATVTNPRILWADEPTGSLDTASAAGVLALFAEAHAAGVTVIQVTHDAGIAAAAQRRIVLRDGRVVADDQPAAAPT